MKRVLLIVGGIVALLFIVSGLYFVFFGQSGESGEYAFFPEAGNRDIPDWLTPRETPEEEEYTPPTIFNPVEVPPARPEAGQPTTERTSFLSLDFLADLYARYRGGSRSSGGTGGTGTGGTVGVPYTPVPGTTGSYPSGDGWSYHTSDDTWINGRPVGDDEDFIRFNPETLELYVGNVHFVFRGGAHLPDNTTSDVVGDPDNMVVGTTLGVLVGSLLGDPGLGLIIGSALGSNMYDGFMLQDIGIAFDNGMPSFGDSLGGLGEEEGEGEEGGGKQTAFGGKVTTTTKCTCATSYTVFTVTGESEYSGNYLIGPTTKKYGGKKTSGSFNILGLYTAGGGSGQCQMYVGESCEEYQTIDKGLITEYSSD
ncbi:MAG: hypothetical protein KBD05_00750 [Candidatus Pacebacteria bacterium]|nr:hypothetical protein [Candidatus Paceibacterota bacterium]